MARTSLVFAGIAPHPPIMVPEVGGSAIGEVRASIDAMKDMAERVILSGAETIVLISPHAPLDARAFVAYHGDRLYGNFARFNAADAIVDASLDKDLLSAITRSARDRGLKVLRIFNNQLDHGIAVPLYFLQRNGWHGKVVCLGYTFLSNDDHLRFGSCIRSAIDELGIPVAIIASGDLSHRLKLGAPAGFHKNAYLFDEEIVDAIRERTPERIINVDAELRTTAGECGYRSILVALGATEGLSKSYELLSYEAPFGVGYIVAQLSYFPKVQGDGITEEAHLDTDLLSGQDTVALARTAVETFIREKLRIKPALRGLNFRAACFVSIKTETGDLRGCIGTVEPTQVSFEEEVIENAINAATRDLRFPVVSPEELPYLRYSVDVLSGLEPAGLEQLDASLYGVIVEEVGSSRRGVLLPRLAGVETVEQQVAIATRKAGVDPGSAVRFLRFRVTRFRESDSVQS